MILCAVFDIIRKRSFLFYGVTMVHITWNVHKGFIGLKCFVTGRKKFYVLAKLKKYSNNRLYEELIRQKAEKLYSEKSFPIDDMNEYKYHTCYNIMHILYHADEEKFLKYCDSLICDKMARYRIQHFVEEFSKG